MRSRDLSRFALSICALVVMLAGCGGSQPPIGASGELPQAPVLATRPHGTNYKVAYSFGAQPDGIHPDASLIDIGGTLYGTTAQGGTIPAVPTVVGRSLPSRRAARGKCCTALV